MNQTASETKDGVSFSGLVLGFSSAALHYLGEAPLDGQPTKVNLVLAKQNIDFLNLLADKTKGNLNRDEKSLLDQVLTDLRLKYVEVQKASVP